MIHALPDAHSDQDRKRSGRRIGAVAVIAILTLGACTSDPGARRVAQDIIKAETEDDPSSDRRDCMLKVLEDDFTDEDLENITSQLGSTNTETQAEGQAALDEYDAALSACN